MASALCAVPEVGTVAAGAAPILSAVSKLQISSVPQDVKGFGWYVEKVTFGAAANHGVMQGVVWAIPKEMFEDLGGRLTGSLAVSFIPTASGDPHEWQPKAVPMLAHAVVYADSEHSWVPAQTQFVGLTLSPKPPVADGVSPAGSAPTASHRALPALPRDVLGLRQDGSVQLHPTTRGAAE